MKDVLIVLLIILVKKIVKNINIVIVIRNRCLVNIVIMVHKKHGSKLLNL